MKEKYKIFKFFLKLVKKLQPKLFLLRGFYALFRTIEVLIVMYIPSAIILMLTGSFSYQKTIIYTLGGLLFLLIIRIANKFLNKNAFVAESEFSYNLKLLLKVLKKN